MKAKMYQIHCKLHHFINITSGLWTDFLKVKKIMKICSNTHHSQNFSGKHAPKPPSKRMATQRVASPLPQKNSCPPLANPAYAYELLLRNLFENPSWQTVDGV